MKVSQRLKGNQINWNQVFYFSEIAACGSIKDAAAKLGLSSPTLSEHLAQLERDLEIQLFFRHHRKLTLTPEGNRLYLRAKEMFEAGQRLIDVVSPVPLGCYPVSVGLVPGPSIQQAYSLIGDYADRFGPLNMKLIHSSQLALEAGLSKAAFDFGFSDRLSERKDITSHVISSSPIRFYVSTQHHGHASFGDLLGRLPVLICNAEPNVRTATEQALIDAGLAPRAVISSDYPSSLLELCRKGLGIGVFSEATFEDSEEELKPLRTPRDAPKLQNSLYAMWSKEAENTEAVRHLKLALKIK